MDKYALGKKLLLAGCFLLPTSGYIGPIFILFSCICGSSLQGARALLAKKMYPLYLLIALILVSSLTSPFGLESCAGIFNWLPFVWLFWSLSIYFKCRDDMRRVATALIFGTIPILVIGFTQLIFKFSDSPRLFGSFIVWHMLGDSDGFSGIFYNRNICSAWLSASLPFFIAAISCESVSRKNLFKQLAAWLILMSVSFAMVMTDSRNSIAALFLGSLVMLIGFVSREYKLSRNSLFVVGAIASMLFIAYSLVALFVPAPNLLDALIQFVSDNNRLEIWKFGVSISYDNLLYGFGPNGFSSYASLLSPFERPFNHVHSLPLDLWVSYGLLASVVLLLYVFIWLFSAVRLGIMRDGEFSRAWFTSFLLLIIFHVTDLPYLDARINLVGWILFTGIVSYVESSGFWSAES